jgi:hypothetical protein
MSTAHENNASHHSSLKGSSMLQQQASSLCETGWCCATFGSTTVSAMVLAMRKSNGLGFSVGCEVVFLARQEATG